MYRGGFLFGPTLKRKFKYEFGRYTAPIKHGALPGDIEHSDGPHVFDTYDFMMRTLGNVQCEDLDDDVPVMSRAGWDR